MGCDSVFGSSEGCYLENVDLACAAIRSAGEIGPGAAAVAYYEAMRGLRAEGEARRWIARLDLSDSISEEE
jgi:hypothetical protein